MEILAHRGIWVQEQEKNSLGALLSAVESGFGIETDVRDLDGVLVVSHDPPRKGCLTLETFLQEAQKLPDFRKVTYALNIKADGLDKELERILKEYRLEKNAFFFDMSNPTLYHFSKRFPGGNLCTRISDIEPEPVLQDSCAWMWVDCFQKDWSDWAALKKFKHRLAFVSPDLHKREHEGFWKALREFGKTREGLSLCTDLPKEAKRWFV
ncbi:MAG: hypothetical protein ABIF01_01375 [Candidatus Micrarchaeota archaeon]